MNLENGGNRETFCHSFPLLLFDLFHFSGTSPQYGKSHLPQNRQGAKFPTKIKQQAQRKKRSLAKIIKCHIFGVKYKIIATKENSVKM